MLVEGSHNGPPNTGITLNGIPALVSNGHFVVNKIPLQTGVNTLTVALTTLTGKTVTANLAVTSLGNPSVLDYHQWHSTFNSVL